MITMNEIVICHCMSGPSPSMDISRQLQSTIIPKWPWYLGPTTGHLPISVPLTLSAPLHLRIPRAPPPPSGAHFSPPGGGAQAPVQLVGDACSPWHPRLCLDLWCLLSLQGAEATYGMSGPGGQVGECPSPEPRASRQNYLVSSQTKPSLWT